MTDNTLTESQTLTELARALGRRGGISRSASKRAAGARNLAKARAAKATKRDQPTAPRVITVVPALSNHRPPLVLTAEKAGR